MNRVLRPHVEYRLRPVEGAPEPTDGAEIGELLCKTGDYMFEGYYRDDARTRAAFTEDGFYKTGDVVRITTRPNGTQHVEVIGRAKTSIKLGNGRWVFPESLEDTYRQVHGVQQIMLHGTSQHDTLVAIVDAKRDGVSADTLVDDLKLAFKQVAVNAKLEPYETIAAVVLTSSPMCREDKTLNATGKVHRGTLRALYNDEIEACWRKLDAASAEATLETMSPLASFGAQGGTSLQASKIAALYRTLGVPINWTIRLLLDDDKPVERVVNELSRIASGDRVNPFDDLSLQDDFPDVQDVVSDSIGPDHAVVLLTGATGLLGPFLLAEVLETTHDTTVICLVRAPNSATALQRVQDGLVKIGRHNPESYGRIQVVCGRLDHPRLGLLDHEWVQLQQNVTHIIHSGAKVDLQSGYSKHRNANVLGTNDVLHLAMAANRRPRVLLVSTSDVVTEESGKSEEFLSRDAMVEALDQLGGYAASKLVAEGLVRAAADRGVDCCVGRLGMVASDTISGVCNPRDFGFRLILGMAHARAFPETEAVHTMVHQFPVDTAAAVLVQVAMSKEQGVVHVASSAPPITMTELAASLRRFGSPFVDLPTVPFNEWVERVEQDAQVSLMPVLHGLDKNGEFPRFNSRPFAVKRILNIVNDDTRAQLAAGYTEDHLHKALDYIMSEE